MAAIASSFMVLSIVEVLWAIDVRLAPPTNQSGQLLTNDKVFVDGCGPPDRAVGNTRRQRADRSRAGKIPKHPDTRTVLLPEFYFIESVLIWSFRAIPRSHVVCLCELLTIWTAEHAPFADPTRASQKPVTGARPASNTQV
jgi:hypothetical protein